MSDSDAGDGADPDHCQRNDCEPFLPDDQLPIRPQQPPPADPVQQQIRLLVQAVRALQGAVYRSDSKHMVRGSSVAPTTAYVDELAYKVAQLGGWEDSLLTPGTRVGNNYIVGEPEEQP